MVFFVLTIKDFIAVAKRKLKFFLGFHFRKLSFKFTPLSKDYFGNLIVMS